MITLDSIALKYGTDKSSAHHFYTRIYETYFEPIRQKEFTLLEIGFGGYEHYTRGGEGAKTWLEYFTRAKIYSIDLHAKAPIPSDRFKFFQGSQIDPVFLNGVTTQIGQPDIIIDDASHINQLTIETFKILFPLLRVGGMYVVEDSHTSYWEELASDGADFGGSRNFYGTEETSVMNFFKKMCDDINLEESIPVRSIHFYKQMIFIFKK